MTPGVEDGAKFSFRGSLGEVFLVATFFTGAFFAGGSVVLRAGFSGAGVVLVFLTTGCFSVLSVVVLPGAVFFVVTAVAAGFFSVFLRAFTGGLEAAGLVSLVAATFFAVQFSFFAQPVWVCPGFSGWLSARLKIWMMP